MTIVLKHLAKEFDLNPRRIRTILRDNEFTTRNSRWVWDEDDPTLVKIRDLLKKETKK